MIIGSFIVSSTRDSKWRKPLDGRTSGDFPRHRLRIRDCTGQLICELFPAELDPDRIGHSDPWNFVKKNPMSRSRKEFVRQLQEQNVSLETIKDLLKIEIRGI